MNRQQHIAMIKEEMKVNKVILTNTTTAIDKMTELMEMAKKLCPDCSILKDTKMIMAVEKRS